MARVQQIREALRMQGVARRSWVRAAAVGTAALLVVGAAVAVAGDDGATNRVLDKSATAAGRVAGRPTGGGASLAPSPSSITGARLADESAKAATAPMSDMANTEFAGSPAVGSAATEGGDAAQIAPPPSVPNGQGNGTAIVRSADIALEVPRKGLRAAFDAATGVAAANDGFVSDSSTSSGEEGGSANLVVRVPADRFDAARRALGELGDVESEAIRGQDVSGQLVDHEARLRSLRAEENVLQELLGKARNVGEVIQVQGQLFSVRQQIEQLGAQKAHLEAQAAMSSIQVSMFEPGAAAIDADEPSTGLARSFERAVNGAEAVVGGSIVALGYLLPLALLGALIWLALRLGRRRAEAPPVTVV